MSESSDLIKNVSQEIERTLSKVSPESVEGAIDRISQSNRIFLAGAGRSALAVRGHAMRLMHLGKQVFMVGDVTTPAISKSDLLIIGSGSGRTASLLAAAKKASALGSRIPLVTIDPKSPIAELADHVVVIPAPSPKAKLTDPASSSIQPMGALFEQCLFILLDAIIVRLMDIKSVCSEEMFTRHANLE